MTGDDRDDPRLDELQELLGDLLVASRLWCQGRDVDLAAIEAIRHRSLAVAHQRYVKLIPVYRRLAESCALPEVKDLGTIARELMLTDEVFKSYPPESLAEGDFASLTAWLGEIFIRRPRIPLDGVRDVRTWRERLREDEVFLSYSSGTSGRLSFIPRDRLTWSALCRNGASYTPTVFAGQPVAYSDFDCLVLGFPGNGTGIQGAGTGLAQVAARAHFLFDLEMDADLVRILGSGARNAAEEEWAGRFTAAAVQGLEAAYSRAFGFLRNARGAGRPVLLFGTPFQIHQACQILLAEGSSLPLPSRSIAVSGGGWKSFEGERVEREVLLDRLQAAFGIPPSHVIDTYSTSELNVALMSCPHGRYHVPPLLEAVVLDDLLEPVPGDDALGTLGFLDPFAFSYPGFLITGDQARLVRGRCPCGLAGAALLGEIRRRPQVEAKGCGGVMAAAMSG